jgi:hypothetical protein
VKNIYKTIDVHQVHDVPVIATVGFDSARVGLQLVTDSGVIKASLLITPGETLALANRLDRAAKLVLQEAEDRDDLA